jgi:tetratricopeptide (TPR) repeat protein
MATRLGNKTDEGEVQCCLGAILRQLGHYSEAEACLRSSLEFHRTQHERVEAGQALYELAMLLREEGNFQQAASYAQEGLTLLREVGNELGVDATGSGRGVSRLCQLLRSSGSF